MKILHTITTLNKSWGGPSSCTYNLVKGLNGIGVKTDVLALKSNDPQDLIGTDPFIRYADWDIRTPLYISKSYGDFLKGHADEYDIIHGNTIWLWTTHQACRAALKNRKPLVLSPHGMLYPQALKVSAWKKKIISPLFLRNDLRHADVLHVTSEQEAEHVRDFGLKNPIALIPNGLLVQEKPTLHDHTHNGKLRFGFVGRINRIKNLDLLFEVWNKLGELTSNAELVIIGKDDDVFETELRRYAKANSLNNIHFEGFLSGKKLWDAVSSLDCLVLPSKSENFGMVVTEALVRQVPVIASKGTPWRDLESYNCGIWCDSTINEMTQSIGRMITLTGDERKLMGERGRKLVIEKYTIDKIASHMRDLYSWILGEGSRPEFIID